MKCGDYELLISAYADREIDKNLIPDIEKHLNQCDSCRQFYEETVEIQNDITDVLSISNDCPDFVGIINSKIKPKNHFVINWRISASAAAVLVLAFGILFWQNDRQEKPIQEVIIKNNEIIDAPTVINRSLKSSKINHKSDRTVVYTNQRKKTFIHIPNKLSAKPITESEPESIAKSNIDLDQPEVNVEYIDPVDAVQNDYNKVAEHSIKPPIANPGQRVVSDIEEIVINGKLVKRICYRVITDLSGKPQNQVNPTIEVNNE